MLGHVRLGLAITSTWWNPEHLNGLDPVVPGSATGACHLRLQSWEAFFGFSQISVWAYRSVLCGIPCDLNRTDSLSCQTAFARDASRMLVIF